jgi:hypothetical protein
MVAADQDPPHQWKEGVQVGIETSLEMDPRCPCSGGPFHTAQLSVQLSPNSDTVSTRSSFPDMRTDRRSHQDFKNNEHSGLYLMDHFHFPK